jgi:hypothetical protein
MAQCMSRSRCCEQIGVQRLTFHSADTAYAGKAARHLAPSHDRQEIDAVLGEATIGPTDIRKLPRCRVAARRAPARRERLNRDGGETGLGKIDRLEPLVEQPRLDVVRRSGREGGKGQGRHRVR